MMDMRLGTSLATCRRCCWSLACSGISLQRGSCEWSARSKHDELSTSLLVSKIPTIWAAGVIQRPFPFLARGRAEGGAKPVRIRRCSSDVNLLGYGKGVINLNAEVAYRALDRFMAQQQLRST